MKNKLMWVLLGSSVMFHATAMWKPLSGQILRKRNKVHFVAVATIICNKPNNQLLTSYLKNHNAAHVLINKDGKYDCEPYYKCDGSCTKTPSHPLITAGQVPYKHGNGGLLNPTLLSYSVIGEPVENGARITIEGVVKTEGIAPYDLNATAYGNHYNSDKNITYAYEMTQLEEAILGALKERSVDRGLSDLTDAWFSGGDFLHDYCECVKKEWTSNLSDDDDGKCIPECVTTMKRYFPRSVYWSSKWNKSNRQGKELSERLSGWSEDGSTFKVSLDTFKIDVTSE